jgi:hypothetical protein
MVLVGDAFWEPVLASLASQGWRLTLLPPTMNKRGYAIYAMCYEGVVDDR